MKSSKSSLRSPWALPGAITVNPKVPSVQRQFRTRSSIELLEYWITVLMCSILWFCIVIFVLAWLKFPFHRHRIEVAALVVVPILLMVAILTTMDYIFVSEVRDDKKIE